MAVLSQAIRFLWTKQEALGLMSVMLALIEALEREVAMGKRFIPRAPRHDLTLTALPAPSESVPAPSRYRVAFIATKAVSAPDERRNHDFVDSIAKALELKRADYVLVEPMQVPAAKLWVFFGDLAVAEIQSEHLIRTESIQKIIETTSLKRDLWNKLKVLKESLAR